LKAKLASAVTKAATKKKPVRIGDGDGLMLVVRPSGDSSWILRYRHNGDRPDLTLGRWPEVTLKLAREEANNARTLVAAGIDPMDTRKAEREQRQQRAVEATRKTATVRKLFDDWLAKCKHSKVYHGNIEAAFVKDVLPAIGALQPHEVKREQILKILREIEDRGAVVMVRRVRMWMRKMFEFGIEHEDWPELEASPVPMGTLKSFRGIKARHFPAITDAQQVPALVRRLHAINDNAIIRAALLMSAHTFQRPSEIREATWTEFDLDAARWTIPAERMKGRQEHWVPLSAQVVALLRTHAGVVGDEGLLFPGRRYNSPISEGTLTGRLNAMGFHRKHSPHGFRAMARTVMDEHLRIDPRFIEKQLAHENDSSGLRGAYNRAQYWDERVKMMQVWSDWLQACTEANALAA
jgi:integrase